MNTQTIPSTVAMSGHVDLIEGDRIAGWAWDHRKPESNSLVEVRINGQVVTVVLANELRSDLLQKQIGNGKYGFDIRLGLDLSSAAVTVRNLSTDTTLMSSQMLTTHRSSERHVIRKGTRRPVVNIYTVTFFDVEGKKLYPGGAERYIFDLKAIFDEANIETRIYQAGTTNWTRDVFGMKVQAIKWDGTILGLSAAFASETPAGSLNIYSPFTLASSNLHRPSVGICHGVYWDINDGIFNGNQRTEILSALKHLDRVVSVDANSINSFRTFTSANLNNVRYVANYVSDAFFCQPKKYPTKGTVKLLYPRRLYRPRGYWLAIEAFERLFRDGYDVSMWFVGDADAPEREHVQQMNKKYGERVKWEICTPDEMQDVYGKADIALIPTVNSEGTSLSCLEAMAAGNVVVATDVGGLSNIVINRYNGVLVAPEANSIYQGIKQVLDNKFDLVALKKAAQETARSFSHRYWKDAWIDECDRIEALSIYLKNRSCRIPSSQNSFGSFVHVLTDGIDFAGCSLPTQRPHQLMRALGRAGAKVIFHGDQDQHCPQRATENVEVIGRGAEIYAERVILYIYYAYNLWAIEPDFDKAFKGLPADSSQLKHFQICRDRNRNIIRQPLVWFDLIDLPEIHNSVYYMRAVEIFIKKARFVSTSSRVLFERYRSVRPDIQLLENAANPGDFFSGLSRRSLNALGPLATVSTGIDRLYEAKRRTGMKSKVVTYYGAIASWFDFPLYEYMISQFQTALFVLAGPIDIKVESEMERLLHFPNVVYLGPLPYSSLRLLLEETDVAIIPFVRNAITNVTNPVKLFEYLAASVPVVSTKMDEIEMIVQSSNYGDLIHLASGKADFVRKLKGALNISHPLATTTGVIENSWLQRASKMLCNIGMGSEQPYPSILLSHEDVYFQSAIVNYQDTERGAYWAEMNEDTNVLIGSEIPLLEQTLGFCVTYAFHAQKDGEAVIRFDINLLDNDGDPPMFTPPQVDIPNVQSARVSVDDSIDCGFSVIIQAKIKVGLYQIRISMKPVSGMPLLGKRLDKPLIKISPNSSNAII